MHIHLSYAARTSIRCICMNDRMQLNPDVFASTDFRDESVCEVLTRAARAADCSDWLQRWLWPVSARRSAGTSAPYTRTECWSSPDAASHCRPSLLISLCDPLVGSWHEAAPDDSIWISGTSAHISAPRDIWPSAAPVAHYYSFFLTEWLLKCLIFGANRS